jgi:hypothetical protein
MNFFKCHHCRTFVEAGLEYSLEVEYVDKDGHPSSRITRFCDCMIQNYRNILETRKNDPDCRCSYTLRLGNTIVDRYSPYLAEDDSGNEADWFPEEEEEEELPPWLKYDYMDERAGLIQKLPI